MSENVGTNVEGHVHPHTPGPWYIEPGTLSILSEVAGDATVCEVMEADDFPCVEEGTEADVQAECEANARLIAAAPEMLRLLIWISDSFPGYIPDFIEPVAKLRNKIEGRS